MPLSSLLLRPAPIHRVHQTYPLLWFLLLLPVMLSNTLMVTNWCTLRLPSVEANQYGTVTWVRRVSRSARCFFYRPNDYIWKRKGGNKKKPSTKCRCFFTERWAAHKNPVFNHHKTTTMTAMAAASKECTWDLIRRFPYVCRKCVIYRVIIIIVVVLTAKRVLSCHLFSSRSSASMTNEKRCREGGRNNGIRDDGRNDDFFSDANTIRFL